MECPARLTEGRDFSPAPGTPDGRGARSRSRDGLRPWDGCYTFSVSKKSSRRRKAHAAEHPRPAAPRSATARLEECERLFREFEELTPYPYPKAFTKSFATWDEYEKWRRAQTNPWLR